LAVAFWLFSADVHIGFGGVPILGSLFFGLGFVLIAALSIRAAQFASKTRAALRAQAMQTGPKATAAWRNCCYSLWLASTGLNAGKQRVTRPPCIMVSLVKRRVDDRKTYFASESETLAV